MKVSFKDTLRMVVNACKSELYGVNGVEKTALECATKIYIELNNKGRNDSNDKNEA